MGRALNRTAATRSAQTTTTTNRQREASTAGQRVDSSQVVQQRTEASHNSREHSVLQSGIRASERLRAT